MITRLSEHFTLQEATISQTASMLGIDNSPDDKLLLEMMQTAQFMEEIRKALGERPITVTSWYRCPDLERAITGIAPGHLLTGHHPKGAAVDFICPGYGTPLDICLHLKNQADRLGIGQLIYEYRKWVHISRLPVPNPAINRFLTIDEKGTRSGILA